MITFTDFLKLDEERSHPELNPVISSYDELKPYSTDPNAFISFTQIDKIGINPHSKYATPNGIYTYPLKQTWKEYSVDENKNFTDYPFASESPFVWLVKAKNPEKLLYVSKYSKNDLQRDVDILKDYVEKNHLFTNPDNFNKIVKDAHTSEYSFNNPAGILFVLTRSLSSLIKGSADSQSKRWSTLLRIVLKFDGVVDDLGLGVIHAFEPIQAVFFSRDALDVKLKAINKRQTAIQGSPVIQFLKKSFNRYGNSIGIIGRSINQNTVYETSLPESYYNIVSLGYPLLANWLKSKNVFAASRTENVDQALNLEDDLSKPISIIYPNEPNKALIASKYNENTYNRDIEEIYKKLYPENKTNYNDFLKKVDDITKELHQDKGLIYKPGSKAIDVTSSIINIHNMLTDTNISKTEEQTQKLTDILNLFAQNLDFMEYNNIIIEQNIKNPLIRLLFFASTIAKMQRSTKKINTIMSEIGYEYIIDDNKTLFPINAIAFFSSFYSTEINVTRKFK